MARDLDADFVAYRLGGDAIRLHPGSKAEAIPVWSPGIRALAMDWSVADPLPGFGTQTREADYGNISVFRHISDHDRINGKAFQAWLTAEMSRAELRDITEPAADGSWFPWPLLLASVACPFLSGVSVTKVATCRLVDGSIGLMFHSKVNGDVVIMRMTNGSLDVQQGDMALPQVVGVASP